MKSVCRRHTTNDAECKKLFSVYRVYTADLDHLATAAVTRAARISIKVCGWYNILPFFYIFYLQKKIISVVSSLSLSQHYFVVVVTAIAILTGVYIFLLLFFLFPENIL